MILPNIFYRNDAFLWNIFNIFVANFKSMENNSLRLGSLFPDKGDFDYEDFENKCVNYGKFIYCIQQGVTDAMRELDTLLRLSLCTRNKSAILHDLIARCIKNNIDEHMYEDAVECYIDQSGNKRNILEYNGYTFILRKNIDSCNDTVLSHKIDEQELDQHIITINYAVDPFWTKIASLSLLYIQNNYTLYTHSINISDVNNDQLEILMPENRIEEIAKPTLKTKEKIRKKSNLA